MFLAAILLKLGGYGIILLAPFAVARAIKGVLVPLALVGGALAAVITILQVDRKTLIAYSSVAHIALVIAALSSESPLGFGGGVALIVAHALASSGLFYRSFVLYSRSRTRSLLLARSNLRVLPVLSLWVFILVIANMGAPPTVNLLREVLTVSSILGQSLASFLPLGVVLMAAVAFSLVYYNSTQHGQEPSLSSSLAPLHSLERAVLRVHGGSTIAAFFVVNLFL
jgi:NADH:ubiquinone oxidoreductase subunit 4 (subunit M)